MPRRTSLSQFLNVDLDLYSRSNLDPLVEALGKRVIILYSGRRRQIHEVHLEVAASAMTADAVIKRFGSLINSLPRTVRKLWDTAKRRDFNIGVQAAMRPSVTEMALEPETVRLAASLNARIVITVYAPHEGL